MLYNFATLRARAEFSSSSGPGCFTDLLSSLMITGHLIAQQPGNKQHTDTQPTHRPEGCHLRYASDDKQLC